MFWIVPAKVQGKWRTSQGEFDLKQQYQMLSGKMKAGNATTEITGGKMTGDQIVAVGRRHHLHRPGEWQHHRRKEQVGIRRDGVAGHARQLAHGAPSCKSVARFSHRPRRGDGGFEPDEGPLSPAQ